MKLRATLLATTAAMVMSVSATAWAETVKIGVILGLSGPPVIVDFGESYLQGLEMAVEEYNQAKGKYTAELLVYNDEAKPDRAVALAQRLITNDKVPVAIGTVSSGNTAAFAPMFQNAKVPLMAGPAIATDITAKFINEKPSYIFRCSMVEKYQVDAMLDWAVKTYKKIGLLHTTLGYGIFAAGEIKKGMAERGAELVAVESVAPDVTDVSPQVLKLKNAGVELVLNFNDTYELLYRAMVKTGWHPAVAGNWGLSSEMLYNVVGKDAINGSVMGQAVDIDSPRAKAFDEKLRAKYGAKYRWPAVVALGYDGARLVLGAIDRAGTSPGAIRDALETTKGFQAVSAAPAEPYSTTNHECLSRTDVFLGQWQNGRVVRLTR